MSYFPSVIDRTGRSTKTYDLPTKLFSDRIVFLSGTVNELSADSIIMQLVCLNNSSDEDINLYIKSRGGSVVDGQAIKNVMDRLSCKVNTIGMGQCCSMGAYLLASGTGTRSAMEDCRIMVHSVISGLEGSFPDLKVNYEEIKYTQERVIGQMAEFTKGKTSLEEMTKICQRDYFMSAEEAVQRGLIDEVASKTQK